MKISEIKNEICSIYNNWWDEEFDYCSSHIAMLKNLKGVKVVHQAKKYYGNDSKFVAFVTNLANN